MDNLKNILADIRLHSQAANRRELAKVLRLLMNNRRSFYFKSLLEEQEEEFAGALYKILLLELDSEEDESIEVAELAYLAISSALRRTEGSDPEHYKLRLLLLHYFCDYFTDSIIEVFLAKYRADNMLQARSLAFECLEKMQLADMFYLEENEANFINRDEQLIDACNGIQTNPDLSQEEKTDAVLLHKVLYAYLMSKYKN